MKEVKFQRRRELVSSRNAIFTFLPASVVILIHGEVLRTPARCFLILPTVLGSWEAEVGAVTIEWEAVVGVVWLAVGMVHLHHHWQLGLREYSGLVLDRYEEHLLSQWW